MSFLSGAFLFAALAVAVPIIIHLIHRQRYPDRRFTTLRFFDKTVKHNVVQKRLIDRILLALRVLALLAIAFGLARPLWNLGIGEKRRSVVIVLDNSPSMSRERDGKTLFDQARNAAGTVLDALGATDRVALILTSPGIHPTFTQDHDQLKRDLERRVGQPAALLIAGEIGRDLAIPGLTDDHATLAAAIDKLPSDASAAIVGFADRPNLRLDYSLERTRQELQAASVSFIPGDVRGALASAAKLLKESHDGERRMVLLSDLQRSEWAGGNVDDLDDLSMTIGAIDPPANQDPNLAIEGVMVARETTLGSTLLGTASIHNYGDQPSGAANLRIVAGDIGRVSQVSIPAIAAFSTVHVSFPISAMSRDRNFLCSATITSPTEPYPYDNTWNFQLGLRPPVTVLVVNGVPGNAVQDKESFFVVNALSPRSSTAESLADVRECEPGDLKDQQLFQYAVVVLAGVPTLDKDARDKLQQFVNDGGGLLVFPGGKSAPEDYNAWEFLPAKILERRTGDLSYIRSISQGLPAVAEVSRRVGAGINVLSSSQWMRLEPQADSTVLAHLSGGSPALVERSVGRGKVILAAAGCHVAVSDWPLRPAFVILVRSMVSYLGSPAVPVTLTPDRAIGESAAMTIPTELSAGSPSLFRLTRREALTTYEPLAWHRASQRLAMPAAPSPGQYLLSVQPGVATGAFAEPGVGAITTPVSVNHQNSESLLSPLASAELTALLPGANLSIKRVTDDGSALVADLAGGREIWRWLLMGALLFLTIEGLLAWRTQSESAN